MWGIVMQVNHALFALSGVFLIYCIGAGLLRGEWKQLLLGFLLFVFFGILQIVIAAIIEA